MSVNTWAYRFADELGKAIYEQLSFGPVPGLSKSAAVLESELIVKKLQAKGIKAWVASTKVCVSITREQAWRLIKALNAVQPKEH